MIGVVMLLGPLKSCRVVHVEMAAVPTTWHLQFKSLVQLHLPSRKSRWWFQIFLIFNPIWGRFPFWLIFFRWLETTFNQIFPKPFLDDCDAKLASESSPKDWLLRSQAIFHPYESKVLWSRGNHRKVAGCWTIFLLSRSPPGPIQGQDPINIRDHLVYNLQKRTKLQCTSQNYNIKNGCFPIHIFTKSKKFVASTVRGPMSAGPRRSVSLMGCGGGGGGGGNDKSLGGSFA